MMFDAIPPSLFLVLGVAVVILVIATIREQSKQQQVRKLEDRVNALEKQVHALTKSIRKTP